MHTQILTPSTTAYAQVCQALNNHQVVAIPTETVYGLAGNAFDELALSRIFAAKERPFFDPLIVHLADQPDLSLAALAQLQLISPQAIPFRLWRSLDQLIAAFWPGPLTLVLPRAPQIPDLVTAGLETVALRVPDHPVAQDLLRQSFPLAAPSANRFGHISPTTAQAVLAELDGRIPWILDGGACEVGVESTIIGIKGQQFELLRPGGLEAEEIEDVLNASLQTAESHPIELRAPGMLSSHYAPRHDLLLFESVDALTAALKSCTTGVGLLLQSATGPELQQLLTMRQQQGQVDHLEVLSASGDSYEAAQRLFQALRSLDQGPQAVLWAELPADTTGLNHAICDRLLKAAAPKS